jgi:hypothetical protein
MSYPAAIVIAAGLIAGAILTSSRVDSQTPTLGKFIGIGVSESGAIAWRIDSTTGEMTQCTASGQRIVCVRP